MPVEGKFIYTVDHMPYFVPNRKLQQRLSFTKTIVEETQSLPSLFQPFSDVIDRWKRNKLEQKTWQAQGLLFQCLKALFELAESERLRQRRR